MPRVVASVPPSPTTPGDSIYGETLTRLRKQRERVAPRAPRTPTASHILRMKTFTTIPARSTTTASRRTPPTCPLLSESRARCTSTPRSCVNRTPRSCVNRTSFPFSFDDSAPRSTYDLTHRCRRHIILKLGCNNGEPPNRRMNRNHEPIRVREC